jgi:hypothetical protein
MITDHEFSERVVSETRSCFEKLNSLLHDARSKLPKGEFQALRAGLGLALGHLYTEVEAPIYKRHPDLEPAGLSRPSSE